MSTQRLLLELEVGSDPIAGRLVHDTGGSERSFSGWMELSAALEAMTEAAEPDDEEDGT